MAFQPTDCYVLITASTGAPLLAALSHPALLEVGYTYERRFGCRTARVRVARALTHPEAVVISQVKTLGHLAIFARDPQGIAQASHPYEPPPPFDTTQYVRVWLGRVASVSFSRDRKELVVEGEGFAHLLDESMVGEVTFTSQTIAQIATSVVGGTGLTLDIESTGRMATVVDELVASGKTRREVLDTLAEIGGPAVDWGVNRNLVFFMRARNNPFHQSAGFLDSVGGEADMADASFERDLRGVRSEIEVVGAKSSPTGPRIRTGLLRSSVAISRFGVRHEDVLREDVRSRGALAAIGRSILRERAFAPVRVRARVGQDVRYRMDEKSLRAVVLRTGAPAPASYASGQVNQPDASSSGFAVRVVAAGAGFILVPTPGGLPTTMPAYVEVVRRTASAPAGATRYTLFTCPFFFNPTVPAFRLVHTSAGANGSIVLEGWTGSAIGTVATYALPSGIVATKAAFGAQVRAGSGAIYRDGVSVATGSLAGFGQLGGTLYGLGLNEVGLDFDDAEYQDFAVWIGPGADRAVGHPIFTALGTHAEAIRRSYSDPGVCVMISWLPFWEGQTSKATILSGLDLTGGVQPRSTATFGGLFGWVAGLVAKAGGGMFNPYPTLSLDRRWGDGDLYGGSPIIHPDNLERSWTDGRGWQTEIDGNLASPSVGRPIAEIHQRLVALESARAQETGTTL